MAQQGIRDSKDLIKIMNIAIIQARMGSSRLPGKVLMELDGKPLLEFMYNRVIKSKLIDKIVVATTTKKSDDPIIDLCRRNKISFYRGSESDVLDRYYKTAIKYNPKTIIRLTSDCPLIDPNLIDRTIELFHIKKIDYASNTVPPEIKKYPDGSDVEVFSFRSLELAWKGSIDKSEREHVTFYFWKSNNSFSTELLDNKYDWGKYRITVDYEEDLIVVKKIVEELKNNGKVGSIQEIVEIIDKNPEIYNLNSKYTWGLNW